MRQERAEALPGSAVEPRPDRVLGQPGMAVALGDLARQHRADGAVDVADRLFDAHRLALFERRLRLGDQLVVERLVETVVLPSRNGRSRPPASPAPGRGCATGRRPCAFQWLIAGTMSSRSTRPTISSNVRKPSSRHQLAHFLGDEEEVVDDVLGLAGEALAQHRVLRRDADRAGVEVALAHHDAAGGDQRRGGEAELVGAEQRADDDVAPGAQPAIDLHRDAAAQAVAHQRLLRLGEADLPGRAGMGQRGQRAGAGAALEPGDRHMVGARLGDAGRDRADPDLGHQLDRHRRPWGWRSSDRGSAAPDPRSNRCRDAAAARSARPRGSNGAPWRSPCRPCGRATGRLRRAWRPAPS